MRLSSKVRPFPAWVSPQTRSEVIWRLVTDYWVFAEKAGIWAPSHGVLAQVAFPASHRPDPRYAGYGAQESSRDCHASSAEAIVPVARRQDRPLHS
jgi:hypothetical protein